MFKFTGIILVFISSTILFSKEIIKANNTYKFLAETMEIATIIKQGCNSGKTYNMIFEESDLSKFRFYYFSDNLKMKSSPQIVDSNRAKAVDKFISHLGERNKYDELEYIADHIDIFRLQAEKYKNYYDKNKQTALLAGLSTAGIITIVLI